MNTGAITPPPTPVVYPPYNHDLSFFEVAPTGVIHLNEFKELAADRVLLLRKLEGAHLKGLRMFSDEWSRSLREDLEKGDLKDYVRLMSTDINGESEMDVRARRTDHISHYLAKLFYCRTEDLRSWFVTRELEWFRVKFDAQPWEAIQDFLHIHNLDYRPISSEEKTNLYDHLSVSTAGMTEDEVVASDFYKVSFLEVLPLIEERTVFLQNGYAYVPTRHFVVCLQTRFKKELVDSVNRLYEELPHIVDERVSDVYNMLRHSLTGNTYEPGLYTDPADLDEFAEKRFPLCMRLLHETLRENHHLRHTARLIYGLFLKGIGLSYESFVEFWKEEYTHRMPEEQFTKKYSYNMQHQWGKVGKKLNYAPYDCEKIITGGVGPMQLHGCPFKHCDPPNLKSKLVECEMEGADIEDIMTLAAGGHCRLACTKYFECMHDENPPEATINHPNQYFSESQRHYELRGDLFS